MKETTKAFFRQLLSVVLGIIITFSLQSTAERIRVGRNVRAALELVRSELKANSADLDTLAVYLKQERRSANYFLAHRKTIDKCPADSITYHSGMVFADASISLSHDALELLKMSSLFQKIGDNRLSMDIIRAYDSCDIAVTNLNRHITDRDAQFDRWIDTKTVSSIAAGGFIDMKKFIKTTYGQYAMRWILNQGDMKNYTDTGDLDAAIESIDAYLAGKGRHKGKNRIR